LQRALECALVVDLAHFAHDPPKCERFGDKIMRHSGILERDRTQNRIPPSDQVRGHALPENALMRIVVIAIGRLKQGPERELAERYRERFGDIGRKLGFRGLEIHEIPESRARDAATRIAEEATAISAAIPAKSVLVALDERGDNVDSAAFARHLGRWRDESVANTIFVIGGADGLSPDLRRKAKLSIAFGSATWPHQMVRVMLLEQVYRAATILAGHPYHRV
jgi:23S rRNA (pseudouridine1915-N3)-methyltransferase